MLSRKKQKNSSGGGSLVVVGDGAVGTAVAVTLSSVYDRVFLAGPPGTPTRERLCSVGGFLSGSARVIHTALGSVTDRGQVVVALKAYDIADAAAAVGRAALGGVVCLSNGMGLDEEWGEIASRVEYASLTVGFRKVSGFSVLTAAGLLYCLEESHAALFFKKAGFPVEEVADMEEHRWAKWYANSVINPVGALSGLANNRLIDAGYGSLIDRLSAELEMLMPSARSITRGRELLSYLLRNSDNRCSMLQDTESGRPTEIDYLTGLCAKKLPGLCPEAERIVTEIKKRSAEAT